MLSVGLMAAAASRQAAFHIGLLLTAFGFGFRHGIDWDHIAALTDITGSQAEPRRSMRLATCYALGHALVVFALGLAAIVLAERLPASVDAVMEHVVGLTLVLLSVYVFYGLVRYRRDFRMRSRWMLIFSLANRALRRLRGRREKLVVIEHDHEHRAEESHAHAHEQLSARAMVGRHGTAANQRVTHSHGHQHIAKLPADPFAQYGSRSSFLVGMIHGVGAETPTQVLVFVVAAGAAGSATGVVLLVSFLVGLLVSNTVVAAAGTFGFLNAARNFGLYATFSITAAVFGLVIGTLFLFGKSGTLPALFGG